MFEERHTGREATFVARVFDDLRFLLACSRNRRLLVEYRPGRRTVRGRTTAYDFKSVEKLRYDFERDAEDALRQD